MTQITKTIEVKLFHFSFMLSVKTALQVSYLLSAQLGALRGGGEGLNPAGKEFAFQPVAWSPVGAWLHCTWRF